MPQTLEAPAPANPTELPLILRGAKPIIPPAVPPIGWSDELQVSVVPGTTIPACLRKEYLPESTSSNVGDNIKDVDD